MAKRHTWCTSSGNNVSTPTWSRASPLTHICARRRHRTQSHAELWQTWFAGVLRQVHHEWGTAILETINCRRDAPPRQLDKQTQAPSSKLELHNTASQDVFPPTEPTLGSVQHWRRRPLERDMNSHRATHPKTMDSIPHTDNFSNPAVHKIDAQVADNSVSSLGCNMTLPLGQ